MSDKAVVNPLAGLSGKYGTILVDPPWRFTNRTGKMAPEHKRLMRYETMKTSDIAALPVESFAAPQSHLYLWTPNALIKEAMEIMEAWGFTYKTNIIWMKVRKDGAPDGRGVGFYFRNVTEIILFGIKGRLRTAQPGRSQVNAIVTRKQEHSRKPDEQYKIIEACSPGPYLELFARGKRKGWTSWGNQAETYDEERPVVRGYNNHVMGAGVEEKKKRGRPKKIEGA
jgi:N6-adenosine-specific RNA methylase IME4